MARPQNKAAKYRDFLKGRMDPDIILDWLLAKAVLSYEEVDEVKSRPTTCQKNQKLLEYIVEKDKEDEFINALRDADQSHLANYLQNDGVRSQDISGDWPLTENQTKIINVNCGFLKDRIDIESLVYELYSKSVISDRQKQLICSKATDAEKNDAFLEILRRRSQGDYENAIQCLRDTKQPRIAKILQEGGAIVPIHANLSETSEEGRLAQSVRDLLQNKTPEEFDRIVGMARYKLMTTSTGHSIIFYYYCKTLQSWKDLKKALRSGQLKITIEQLCRMADSQTNVLVETIHVHDHDLENIDLYFHRKGKRSSNFGFLRSFGVLSIAVAIMMLIADFYAAQTIPCWTKKLECKAAKEKIGTVREMNDRLIFKFSQLENATTELLQTANKDDLASLILEMSKTPNAETLMKFRERIIELEKELLNKGAKGKQAVMNHMEKLLKLLGKASDLITMDVVQFAEALLTLVNDIFTPEVERKEFDAKTVIKPVTFKIYLELELEFLQSVIKRPSHPALPRPPETGEQEAYEEALKEKLKAVKDLIEETASVLIVFIDETEGLNHLLHTILEKFYEQRQQVCLEKPHIKESKTRGYPELRTGMLRLTCLLDETFRMTRLLIDLHKQATSLKEDVERMVEQVNELADQSVPPLMAILLTVTIKQDISSNT